MNIKELREKVAEKAGMTQKLAEKAIYAVCVTIMEALEKEDQVKIIGFGTFKAKLYKPKKLRDIRTKELIILPAKRKPVFIPSAELKEKVKK